jgi:NAD(P)-dependent dehydrogenase (short-subunit alcohol dehydrogenase family)
MNIEGRSIVITGGARGIGLETARELHRRGANLTISARSESSLAEGRRRLGDPDRLVTVASDLKTPQGCREVIAGALEGFGAIDGVFTNAGLYAESSVEELTEELWDQVLDTNLKSAFFTIQAALPSLRSSHGAVVTMSSYNGVDGISGNVSVYGAAKAGVINMTRALALDLAPEVRVNAIAPGFVETEKLLAIPDAGGVIEELGRMTPLGRIAQATEIAHAVVFALENEFLTGATINIDGGRCAGR